MYYEDQIKVFIVENICDKREIGIEDEGSRRPLGIKSDIHIRIHKK